MRLVTLDALQTGVFSDQFEGGVRGVAELEFGSGPAFDRVASLTGGLELPAMPVLVTIGAGVMFQSDEINPRRICGA